MAYAITANCQASVPLSLEMAAEVFKGLGL